MNFNVYLNVIVFNSHLFKWTVGMLCVWCHLFEEKENNALWVWTEMQCHQKYNSLFYSFIEFHCIEVKEIFTEKCVKRTSSTEKMNFKKKLKRKERKRTPQQENEVHSFTWEVNTPNCCIAQDVIKFNLEELFCLVEASHFDFSEEETSCRNERNARKKLDWNHKILNWNN